MNKPITPSTYVRCLNVGLIRKLSDFIDPQEGWKKLAVAIKKPSGDDRYNQFHIRRFEALVQTGKSPTSELLFDWGTTNCTVGDLVDILIQNELFAPASLLLPDAVPKPVNTLPSKEAVTVQQNHMPFYEKGSTPLTPVQNLDQSHITLDSSPENKSLDVSDTRFHCFSFYELKSVTNDFDERPISLGGNKMGEGGFGVVYKGCVNNTTVAVKKLAAMVDISTEELKQQFDQEIQVMAKCQHENLVELLGFSSDGDDLCLVYVYMPNGSLLDRLSCLDGTPPLSWHMRCKIAQGAANGISFLHENHHIHRDIKSANILLDEDFTAKISDFGLARASEKFAQTVMTSRIVGTTAYMAPEALRGEITPKSDIYSFGVVLLEIITGLPAVDENREPQLLLDIKEEIEDEEKTIEDYIDVKINDADSTSFETMYSVASQCLNEKKNRRPDIKKVQQQLQEITPS
ncbi:interleukin-1 receptor-associated kinase 4 isoform X1 [Fukomys damarensis]|uniref:interleukin-1 receptor-associated kinase 4 isoform X1 n=2 Tax=Fukomys damarensis TaxID=885580 RepID=UPI0005401BE0|nr:interleukin-1 receptor-associated kinase 4 isoform X1 [Fukomys damarensis]XP_033619471.1 interleukin-1 receptor-associated kinase 4 isoform X1 [Fukomys damarensis]